MSKNLIDEAKKYIRDYYNNGVWTDVPEIKCNGMVISEESRVFVGELYHFLLESSFLNELTIYWLNSNMGSVREAIEVYNSDRLELDRVNINTAQSIIRYDKIKLAKHFDENTIVNVFLYPEKWLEKYSEILDSLQRKYMNDKVYKRALILDLPKDIINHSLSDVDWINLSGILDTYSRRKIEAIENMSSNLISREMVGYYNYLISSKKLSDTDKKRLSELKMILGINE
jgi:hypothetical protein